MPVKLKTGENLVSWHEWENYHFLQLENETWYNNREKVKAENAPETSSSWTRSFNFRDPPSTLTLVDPSRPPPRPSCNFTSTGVINFKFPLQPHQRKKNHTVWRTWLFIAYSDERLSLYQFSVTSLIRFPLKGWENVLLNLGVTGYGSLRVDAPTNEGGKWVRLHVG